MLDELLLEVLWSAIGARMEQSICEPDVAQSECYRETHLKEELLCSDLESLLLCRLEVLFLADIAH